MELIQKLKAKQFVKQSYSKFKADKLILYPSGLNVFLIVLSLLFLLFRAQNLPSQVPLFYSLPWGEERLASSLTLVILPLSSIVIFIFNLFWAGWFYEKEILLSRVLILSSSFISFLSFYTLMRIILLII